MTSTFASRHIGPNTDEIKQMLNKINVSSIDALIEETIPSSIRLDKKLNLPVGLSEFEYAQHVKELSKKNKLYKSYLGLGYYGTITPAVIQRNILENPGWYTAYTPYQAEIAQGRLEAILNFQTMVMDLTGMPVANASLLDESTAAAEAMSMFYSGRSEDQIKNNAAVFFIADTCFPQTIDVLKTRSVPLGIELVIGKWEEFVFTEKVFGALIQYPDQYGAVNDYRQFVSKAKEVAAMVAVATDLMSLALLVPPGEWGADCVVGNSQRFGVPMGYGGPHAAFFATKDEFKRNIPGRIIGVSIDASGNQALRMALQTEEQHIRRDKATSNICTAQALLAIMAGMYAVYHGPEGIKNIAKDIHNKTTALASGLKTAGYNLVSNDFFDTLSIRIPDPTLFNKLKELSESKQINLRYVF